MTDEWLNEFFTKGITDAYWQVYAQEAALMDSVRAKIFGITPENVAQVILDRSHLLKSVLPTFSQFCQTNLSMLSQAMLQVLWDLWLPLAIKIVSSRQNLGRPFIQGILGGQGTGKTTMCQILSFIIQQLGYCTLCLSTVLCVYLWMTCRKLIAIAWL
jgi:D-glycerate 3-kinase